MVSFIRGVADALTSVLFAAPCRICDGALTRAGMLPICEACFASLEPLRGPMCECCGRPFISETARDAQIPKCFACRQAVYGFSRARSFGPYTDQMVRAISLMKYEKLTRLGVWFARQLYELIQTDPSLQCVDVVVPVPLHSARRKERGYNQAELIAGPLARLLHLPLSSYLLMRTKPRPSRLLLSRRERWLTVRGAYEMRPGARVDNLRVLLVDDVFTTGATLDACARALRKAGAESVIGLTVARAILQGGPSAVTRGEKPTTLRPYPASNQRSG